MPLVRKDAFTLVELLVVIGIIALLIAILLPSLSVARQQSESVTCLSQLRQIGISMIMYVDANRGYFPKNSHSGPDQSWLNSLYPFGLLPTVRLCPTDQREVTPSATSYATNNYTTAPRPYERLVKILKSSQTIYAAETHRTGDHLHATNYVDALAVAAEIPVDRHRRSANYLYCDGHAAPLPAAYWPRDFSPAISPFDPATAK